MGRSTRLNVAGAPFTRCLMFPVDYGMSISDSPPTILALSPHISGAPHLLLSVPSVGARVLLVRSYASAGALFLSSVAPCGRARLRTCIEL